MTVATHDSEPTHQILLQQLVQTDVYDYLTEITFRALGTCTNVWNRSKYCPVDIAFIVKNWRGYTVRQLIANFDDFLVLSFING